MKITSKLIVVDVDVSSLYKKLIDCHADLYKDSFECFENSHVHFCEAVRTLGTKNVQGIRSLFSEGYTCFMMPEHMDTIESAKEKNLELRVWDGKKLLVVLTNTEVNY